MLRDIDGEVGDIYDATKISKISDDLKTRYNAIEQDIRAVAGMYAKVKITHFGGDRRKKAETNIIDKEIQNAEEVHEEVMHD